MASTSTFMGTSMVASTSTLRPAGRGSTPVQARIFRPIRPESDKRTVERGERSQAKKEKKLIPYDQKLFDSIPGKSKKMFNARNVPREGGMAGGGPYQKMNRRPFPNVDPLVYVTLLIGTFLFFYLNATKGGIA